MRPLNKKLKIKETFPSEHVEQQRIVNWLEQRDIVFFAVPNANIVLNMLPKHRQFSVQRHMVAEGMRAGVPDLIILSRPKYIQPPKFASFIEPGEIRERVIGLNPLTVMSDEFQFKYTGVNGIALEVKRIKAKKHKLPCNCMSDEQVYWKGKFEENGWLHILAHGSEDAIEQLERLGF